VLPALVQGKRMVSRQQMLPLIAAIAAAGQPATSVTAPRSRSTMANRMTQGKPHPTMLVLLAVIGIVGLVVARRYGLAHLLWAVNQALGIARVVRAAQPIRKQPARRVRPKVLRFSKPG
jgi:hypothetical protein